MNKLTGSSAEYIAGKDVHWLHSWATGNFSFPLHAPPEIPVLITVGHRTQPAL
jgi:hypothetical protein